MKASHAAETGLLRAFAGAFGAMPWRTAVAAGARVGDALRLTGLRRRVAQSNLALAFPDHSAAWREGVLVEHYRELGRIAAEYPHHPDLLRNVGGRAFAPIAGEEHLHTAAARGRGVILLTGHLGNFELMGASLARLHPVDFVVQPLSNPGAERWIAGLRRACGVGSLSTHGGIKRVFTALRAGRWVAMLGDQDARSRGVFVPFFGRPASTPEGPARIALATGAPIVFGKCVRLDDGRHALTVAPPLVPEGDARDDEAVRELTARHTAILEHAVRERPASWFWLHRRWKTEPEPAR